jgi:low temperature requirement protein LtrA
VVFFIANRKYRPFLLSQCLKVFSSFPFWIAAFFTQSLPSAFIACWWTAVAIETVFIVFVRPLILQNQSFRKSLIPIDPHLYIERLMLLVILALGEIVLGGASQYVDFDSRFGLSILLIGFCVSVMAMSLFLLHFRTQGDTQFLQAQHAMRVSNLRAWIWAYSHWALVIAM